MEEDEVVQPLNAMPGENAPGESAADDNVMGGQAEQEAQEEPMGVPFGWFGITLLLNILQYTVFLGLTMVILIIIRVFMPANMLNP
jgi:hypothetical protein